MRGKAYQKAVRNLLQATIKRHARASAAKSDPGRADKARRDAKAPRAKERFWNDSIAAQAKARKKAKAPEE